MRRRKNSTAQKKISEKKKQICEHVYILSFSFAVSLDSCSFVRRFSSSYKSKLTNQSMKYWRQIFIEKWTETGGKSVYSRFDPIRFCQARALCTHIQMNVKQIFIFIIFTPRNESNCEYLCWRLTEYRLRQINNVLHKHIVCVCIRFRLSCIVIAIIFVIVVVIIVSMIITF